jgi:SAM-dependent methyltransferase
MDANRIGIAYQGSAAARYASWQLSVTSGMEREVARRFQPLIGSSDIVLDFGCGGGGLLAALDCKQKIGVEVNPHSIAAAEAKGVEVRSSLDDITGESIDVVISNHALEHCTQPFLELRRMAKVLRTNGRLVLVLPMDDWRVQRRPVASDRNHHLYAWNPLLLGNLLQEAGFVPDDICIVNRAWPPRLPQQAWERLPLWAFDMLSLTSSIALKRRQLQAIAHVASPRFPAK